MIRTTMAIAAALIITITGQTKAGPILDFDPTSGSTGSNNNQSVGWQFNVLSSVNVTGLAWYDEGLDGLSTAHTVGIFAPDGMLLTSAVIPAGLAATLDGIWRTVAVTPVILTPGTGYIVGGTNTSSTSDRLASNVNHTFVDPRISLVDATFSALTAPDVLVRPTFFSVAVNGFYGPSFNADSGASTVPEPSSLALLGLGVIGLGYFRTRQRNPKS